MDSTSKVPVRRGTTLGLGIHYYLLSFLLLVFLQPWIVSSHACHHPHSAAYLGPCTDVWVYLGQLFLVLHFVLWILAALFPLESVLCVLNLDSTWVSPSLYHGLETPEYKLWDSQDSCHLFPVSQESLSFTVCCPRSWNLWFHIFLTFCENFWWGGKSCPCYSILVGSRSHSSFFWILSFLYQFYKAEWFLYANFANMLINFFMLIWIEWFL